MKTQKTLYPEHPVLLVDDDTTWMISVKHLLNRSVGITNIRTCTSGAAALELIATEPVSTVLLDYSMPKMSGEETLRLIKEIHPDIPVIMLTGLDQLDIAFECVKLGAFDFFVKSSESERMLMGIKRAVQVYEAYLENRRLQSGFLNGKADASEALYGIKTASEKMHRLFRYAESIAKSTHPVLIVGETGSGKELMARAIHKLSGVMGAFVPINAAGLDDQMFSDTLFGHKKGAYSGAMTGREGLIKAAAGGTLFLDEIGDLEQASQIKLLRLLQEREYYPLGSDTLQKTDVRVIAATNCNFSDCKNLGSFRQDLFFRLSSHQIAIPPLRERTEDIVLLTTYFTTRTAHRLSIPVPEISSELLLALKEYDWPGNVRELENVIHDIVTRNVSGKLTAKDFSFTHPALPKRTPLRDTVTKQITDHPLHTIFSHFPTLAEMEDYMVEEVMRLTNNNQSSTARILDISRTTLNKRIKVRSLTSTTRNQTT